VDLEWGPLSLVSTSEELLGRRSSGSGLESRSITLTVWHPLSTKVGTKFADKRQSLSRHSSPRDAGHGVWFFVIIVLELPVKSSRYVISR
jgi:hypothetical protein